jgi:DNA integrity scanning protein DisA with diadenylate cyclase activity
MSGYLGLEGKRTLLTGFGTRHIAQLGSVDVCIAVFETRQGTG